MATTSETHHSVIPACAGMTATVYACVMNYGKINKLGGFRQESKSRWGLLGIRVLETKTTSLRLYLQIWDGENGLIAWEGGQELTSSHETLREDPISFKTAVEQTAVELIKRLP